MIYDILLILLILCFSVFGFIRGFNQELSTLMLWVGSAVFTQKLQPIVSPVISEYFNDSVAANMLSYIGTYIFFVIIIVILTTFIKALLCFILSPIVNHFLGFFLGGVTGYIVATIFYAGLVIFLPVIKKDSEYNVRQVMKTDFLFENSKNIIAGLMPEDKKDTELEQKDDDTSTEDDDTSTEDEAASYNDYDAEMIKSENDKKEIGFLRNVMLGLIEELDYFGRNEQAYQDMTNLTRGNIMQLFKLISNTKLNHNIQQLFVINGVDIEYVESLLNNGLLKGYIELVPSGMNANLDYSIEEELAPIDEEEINDLDNKDEELYNGDDSGLHMQDHSSPEDKDALLEESYNDMMRDDYSDFQGDYGEGIYDTMEYSDEDQIENNNEMKRLLESFD